MVPKAKRRMHFGNMVLWLCLRPFISQYDKDGSVTIGLCNIKVIFDLEMRSLILVEWWF